MRRRRPFFIAIALLLAAAGLTLGGLLFGAKREPAFYTAANQPNDWDTHERSARFLTRVVDLQNEIRSKDEWGDTFSTDDINAFFIENLGPKGRLIESLPRGFHSPRIAIEGDRLKFGVKYREGFWSSVVWLELKVWLVADCRCGTRIEHRCDVVPQRAEPGGAVPLFRETTAADLAGADAGGEGRADHAGREVVPGVRSGGPRKCHSVAAMSRNTHASPARVSVSRPVSF
jgi:hypothetical protein